MSLYRRQSFREKPADLGAITKRERKFVLGKDDTGAGLVHCGRVTLVICAGDERDLDQFHADCDYHCLRRTFVQGMGEVWENGEITCRFRRMSFSVSGPAHKLLWLEQRPYVMQRGGRCKGRVLEEVAVPRMISPTAFGRRGEISTKRLPPVPEEARRTVKPGPQVKEARDVISMAEPYPAAERVVVKAGNGASTYGGKPGFTAFVSHRQWVKHLKRKHKGFISDKPVMAATVVQEERLDNFYPKA